MAMEKQYVVRDTHTRAITAVGYNPLRREVVLGCEDGMVKSWEAEGNKPLLVCHEHKGWVTDFLFWSDPKLLLSSANDGYIIAWSSGGTVADKIHIGMPVYRMAINPRRHQLICAVSAGIRVYKLDEEKERGHVIDTRVLYIAREHTDIVRCLVCHESRIYSAGYDQRLVIYDSSYTGDNSLEPIVINSQAHDAGISCLLLAKDNENNTWIFTGSFDKTVKIWSVDGKLVHKLDNFLGTVTGMCYVPRNKTLWVACGPSYAILFDPKSGENVSDFIGTFQELEEEKYQLQLLKFCPELNQVIGSTSRRHLIVWKYNLYGCITALKCKVPLESLCYTRKVPILIFSGDSDGVIIKWERMQSNHFMYSKELLQISDMKLKEQRRAGSKNRELMFEQQMLEERLDRGDCSANNKYNNKIITSYYTFNKPSVPPLSIHKHPHTTILKIVFIESLDYIIAGSEDGNIYVWGFDTAAVDVLRNMKPQDLQLMINKYSVLLDHDSELLPHNMKMNNESDSVTNRVAGFVCKHVLSEHLSCVTCFVVIGREHGQNSTYLLSGSWDRRLCIWDIEKGILCDTFHNTENNCPLENNELACDGVILDMDYSPTRNEFAYASSDRMVYIRKFSTLGSKMPLVNTLQGHEGEITCVRWNPIQSKWVTGSEDSTVRIWSGHGMNECEQVLATQDPVCAMCIDRINGAIVIGVQKTIKVYDAVHYRLVQTNVGHKDAVRSIIHVLERNQYVSCSWDQTIRIWNAWKLPRRKRASKITKKESFMKVPGRSNSRSNVESNSGTADSMDVALDEHDEDDDSDSA